jgi:hypothetical protein
LVGVAVPKSGVRAERSSAGVGVGVTVGVGVGVVVGVGTGTGTGTNGVIGVGGTNGRAMVGALANFNLEAEIAIVALPLTLT